jgi:hypothetical protein
MVTMSVGVSWLGAMRFRCVSVPRRNRHAREHVEPQVRFDGLRGVLWSGVREADRGERGGSGRPAGRQAEGGTGAPAVPVGPGEAPRAPSVV